jgi:predicted naringenin-chalcone synthase
MFIVGLGTAAPAQRYTQREGWEAAQRAGHFHALSPRSRAILRKVLTSPNGIASRHLALDDLGCVFDATPDQLHERFVKTAPVLAAKAAADALADAGESSENIDALLISTCTGYLCPGLTSYVSQRLGIRTDALLLDLVGQGCAAAVPNLRTAEALLKSGQSRRALSICVEVCSAAFYLDDDPGVLISACLFGDGAGAAVLASEPNGKRKVEWKTSASLLNPAKRDLLRFEQKDGKLRNILAPQVPELAASHASRVLDEVLERVKMKQDKIKAWLLHPGGRDVLAALRQQLGLEENDLRWSMQVLKEFGNVSSASLYFVLQAALADSAPAGYWWLSSFGAGFSCHGALLEVE